MRERRLQVRIDDQDYELLKRASERANMTMSELARFLLTAGAHGILEDNEENMRRMFYSTGQILYGRATGRAPLPGLFGKPKDEDDK